MKKISVLLIIVFMSILGISNANAYSITASKSVYLNSNVTVKIEAKGLIGRFDITSSNEKVLAGSNTKWIEDGTITMNFSAKSVGTATITVNAVDVSTTDGEEFKGARSITINVVKKSTSNSITVNPSYNTNNYLKSLSLEGYDLNPTFNKNTLEYSITVEAGLESINVSATTEDKTASIKGVGEIKLTEGINTVNVVSVAENGNERTYKILITVPEKDPINVKLNNKNYTVIKRKELLQNPGDYDETTVKINDFDIPSFHNKVTDVILVGLKDEKGNIELFSYNTTNGEYNNYKEYSFDKMNLYIHEDNKSEYKSINVKINDENVIAYELDGVKDYYLLYATNTTTGYEGYYLYDKLENSVQRYDTLLLNKVTKEKDKYLALVLVLSCVCFLTMLFLLIEVNRDNKRKNEI